MGLTDVQLLPINVLMPGSPGLTYSEHHSVARDEANTITVDESGTGSSGTYSIDFVGSSESDDTAEGSGGASDFSVTTEGSGHSEYSFHLVINGEYADGVFTITSETYTETGSYTNTQAITLTSESGTDDWDVTYAGAYSLSWTATTSEGQLTYTSFSADSTDTANWHRQTTSGGVSTEAYWDDVSTAQTTGSGTEADFTGSILWHEYRRTASEGSEETTEWGSTTPVSGTAWIGTPYQFTDVGWYAGTSDATGYTFHGETTETASLTEEATWRTSEGSNWQFDVDSFDSSYQRLDTDHVVDDEPGVSESGSGTDVFHRNETYTATDDASGSGSYVGGAGDADYHAVETGDYSVADQYTVTDDESSGVDEDGDPFDLVFNSSGTTTAGGTVINIHDYHDAGSGLALTGSSFTESGSSEIDFHDWGSRNGEAFDETSATPESGGTSVAFPGDPTPVAIPDGMDEAFPLKGMENPNQAFTAGEQWPQQLPTTPVRGRPGQIQDWYNKKILEIGDAAKKKVTELRVTQAVMLDINLEAINNGHARASGTFTYDKGDTFAAGLGITDKVTKADKENRENFDRQNYTDVKLVSTKVEITYAVDMTPSPDITKKRSGYVVAEYRIILNYTAKNRMKQQIAPSRWLNPGTIVIHDGNVETMDIRP